MSREIRANLEGAEPQTGDEDAHPHQACVNRINALRASVRLPPLQALDRGGAVQRHAVPQ